MEESQASAASGPPVNSIEVQNSSDPKAASGSGSQTTPATAGSSLPPRPSVMAMAQMSNANSNVGGSGGASVSTISPGSLNQNPASGSGNGNANNNNAVQFSARDASVLQTPNLNNPNLNSTTTNNNAAANVGVASPRTATRLATLQNSQSNLQNSLASFYQTQNTHLEGAFGALMASIQDHTEELEDHQTNLDR